MTDSPVTLKVNDPTGLTETSVLHAPRLNSLEGMTICELSNAAWEHERIFGRLRQLLQARFPTATILPYTEVTGSRPDIENLDRVSKQVTEKGCDAVIAGMAA